MHCLATIHVLQTDKQAYAQDDRYLLCNQKREIWLLTSGCSVPARAEYDPDRYVCALGIEYLSPIPATVSFVTAPRPQGSKRI